MDEIHRFRQVQAIVQEFVDLRESKCEIPELDNSVPSGSDDSGDLFLPPPRPSPSSEDLDDSGEVTVCAGGQDKIEAKLLLEQEKIAEPEPDQEPDTELIERWILSPWDLMVGPAELRPQLPDLSDSDFKEVAKKLLFTFGVRNSENNPYFIEDMIENMRDDYGYELSPQEIIEEWKELYGFPKRSAASVVHD